MDRRNRISQSLIAINDDDFQPLCEPLLLEIEKLHSFSSVGIHKTKRKVNKGTPDTLARLPSGKLVLVEYTTMDKGKNPKAFFKKLNEDIDKCLEKYSIEKIETIILCFTSRLSPTEEENFLKVRNVPIKLVGLDSLSLLLSGRYAYLAEQYLGIKISTEQLVSIDRFIEQYESSGLATPLSNTFIGRENELANSYSSLLNSKITILTGIAGVGKSKLSLAILNKFDYENPGFTFFSIENNNAPIYEDLRILLDSDKNYVLFIDDANRKRLQLDQILPLLKEKRKGQIKLLMTVRDYAVSDIENNCSDFNYQIIRLEKLSDETIIKILESDDFKITDNDLQKSILHIADGNARLALMAASLVNEISTFNNVTDLFDRYFSSFVKDYEVLKTPKVFKTLGIISFFFNIEKDSDMYLTMFQNFSISQSDFEESIEILDQLELIEQRYNVIKIAEQNLAAYFFFRVFIKDKTLSFHRLLECYFTTHTKRFMESVVFANNHFDMDMVKNSITPALKSFFNSNKHNTILTNNFLPTFWFYLTEETLLHIIETTEFLPIPENSVFIINNEKRNEWHSYDPILKLLEKFLPYPNEDLKNAIELGFDYVFRKPELITDWSKIIQDSLSINSKDYEFGFYRQTILFDTLIENANKLKPQYVEAVFSLAPFFLNSEFSKIEGGRNLTVHTYRIRVLLVEPIKKFRQKIWTYLNDSFKIHPDKSLKVLKKYSGISLDINKDVWEFDSLFVLSIIQSHLNSNNIEHCLIVYDYLYTLKRIGISNTEIEELKTDFTSSIFKTFCVLHQYMYKLKHWHEYDELIDRNEYFQKKQQEIRDYFTFHSLIEFKQFYSTYCELTKIDSKKDGRLADSLDIILQKHWFINSNLFYQFLEHILNEKNSTDITIWQTIQSIVEKGVREALVFYDFIQQYDFHNRKWWERLFFLSLDESIINEEFYEKYKAHMYSEPTPSVFDIKTLSKFRPFNPNIYKECLTIIVKNNILIPNSTGIWVWDETFFDNFSDKDMPLIKEFYYQEEKRDPHFDYDSKKFFAILKRDNTFLSDYINYLCHNNLDRLRFDRHEHLGAIWNLKNAENLIEDAIRLSISFDIAYCSPHEYWANELFDKVPDDKMERAKLFILDFVKRNHTEVELMKVIFNIIKRRFDNLFEKAFHLYIDLNASFENFKKIRWEESTNGIIRGGGTIFSDERKYNWERILKLIIQRNSSKLVIQYRQFVNEQIEGEEGSANWEKKINFLRENDSYYLS